RGKHSVKLLTARFGTCRQFLIDAVEPAIGEDGNVIPVLELRSNRISDLAYTGMEFSGRACRLERYDDVLGMKALRVRNALLLVDAGEHNTIGKAKAFHQLILENLAP